MYSSSPFRQRGKYQHKLQLLQLRTFHPHTNALDPPNQPPNPRCLGAQPRRALAHTFLFTSQRPLYNAFHPSRRNTHKRQDGAASLLASAPLHKLILLCHRHLRSCLWRHIRLHATLPCELCRCLARRVTLIVLKLEPRRRILNIRSRWH